jgi:hypothetical protein
MLSAIALKTGRGRCVYLQRPRYMPTTEKPKKINLNPLLTLPLMPYDTD